MAPRKILGALCIASAALVMGPPAAAQSVKVSNAWVRATAPGQKTAGAYVELTSPTAAALVAAGSPAAGRVELHTMSMDGGIMRMRQVPRIELPAGETVRLGP